MRKQTLIALTKALCDACGIKAQVSYGYAYNDIHNMLQVTLNGQTYHSDPTGVYSGACDIISVNAPNYYIENSVDDDLSAATDYTGPDVSQKVTLSRVLMVKTTT